MTGPLARYIAEPDTPLYRWYREIDNHYHLQTIAQDQRQILEFHRQVYQVNMIRAVGTLRQIRDGQRLGNQTLGGIFDELAHLGASISAHLAHLDARLEDLPNILSAVEGLGTKFDYMGGVVAAGLELIAEEMFAARRVLEEIGATLRKPYKTQAAELRKEAEKWLYRGMNRLDPDRQEDFRDSLRLLEICTKNPIGCQDYTAWFQLGWLLWRHKKAAAEAEAAFNRARRLSEPDGGPYYVLSLRHLALMQYLQGRFQDAYETSRHLGSFSEDGDALYDGARYAAKIGRSAEALDLLKASIEWRPANIVAMWAESDFAGLLSELGDLSDTLTAQARAAAERAAGRWQESIALVREVETIAGMTIELPSGIDARACEAMKNEIVAAGYLRARSLQGNARKCARAVHEHAHSVLSSKREEIDAKIRELTRRHSEQLRSIDSERLPDVAGCFVGAGLVFLISLGYYPILVVVGIVVGLLELGSQRRIISDTVATVLWMAPVVVFLSFIAAGLWRLGARVSGCAARVVRRGQLETVFQEARQELESTLERVRVALSRLSAP